MHCKVFPCASISPLLAISGALSHVCWSEQNQEENNCSGWESFVSITYDSRYRHPGRTQITFQLSLTQDNIYPPSQDLCVEYALADDVRNEFFHFQKVTICMPPYVHSRLGQTFPSGTKSVLKLKLQPRLHPEMVCVARDVSGSFWRSFLWVVFLLWLRLLNYSHIKL